MEFLSRNRVLIGKCLAAGTMLYGMGYVGGQYLRTAPELVIEETDPNKILRTPLPTPEPTPVKEPTLSTPALTSNTEQINLNTATVDDLETIEGIGPSTADNIIQYRTQHGGHFSTLEELRNVPRIGKKTFEKIAPFLKVSPP